MDDRKEIEPHESVRNLTFHVDGIRVKNHATSTSVGELVIGAPVDQINAGYITKYVFSVKSKGPGNGKFARIRSLVFYGSNTVRNGDDIDARVPICEKRSVGDGFTVMHRTAYYKREEIGEEEEAIELIVLGRNETAISVNYEEFTEPKR